MVSLAGVTTRRSRLALLQNTKAIDFALPIPNNTYILAQNNRTKIQLLLV